MRTIAFMLILASLSLAAPAPPQTIVNDASMECSGHMAGDECFRCRVPDGWRIFGEGLMECPVGYERVEAETDCEPLHNAFCCTDGHSGGMGDCAGLMVNNGARQCVFAEGGACEAPDGWFRAEAGEMCPSGYAWIGDAPCAGMQQCAFPAAMLAALVASAFICLSRNGSR